MPCPRPQVVGEEQAEEEKEELGKCHDDAEEAPGHQHRHHVLLEGSPDDRDAAADVDPLIHRCCFQGSSCLPATVWITGEKKVGLL